MSFLRGSLSLLLNCWVPEARGSQEGSPWVLFVCSLQSMARSPRESLQGFLVLPAVLGEQAGEEL